MQSYTNLKSAVLYKGGSRYVAPHRALQPRTVLREEVARVVEGIDGDTLKRVQSASKYTFLQQLDEPSSVANAVGWATRRGGSVDALDRFYGHFDAVEPAAVSAAVAKWLVDERLTVITLSHTEGDPAEPAGASEDGGVR